MSDCVLKVEKLENGYEVEICDPEIQAANSKRKSSWKDPWKSYAFGTAAAAAEFITKKLETLTPISDDEEYAGAFAEAVAEDD